MATALVSRLTKGRSLLGGLTNAFSGLMSSSTGMMSGSTLSQHQQQQQRTFIQMGTRLKVVDNSGAKEVVCIQTLRGKKGARLGDIIICSVKQGLPEKKKGKDDAVPIGKKFNWKDFIGTGKVRKGNVVYGVVVRAKMQKGRVDGSQVCFDDNAIVILGIKEPRKEYSGGFYQPIGTRVFGPVPHELRLRKQLKILALAQDLV
ncbi:50S ribosomal protein HLL, mitochondrial-like [Brassica napus]|uniref:50S ribosomal protein HLL, mitochondrial-like n=1 Tax=Brassica napus TaxID=3708 RepID=UPI00207870FF|nr:50S ribosomal protein HLL, mitochondrial-like [Brassica napus]